MVPIPPAQIMRRPSNKPGVSVWLRRNVSLGVIGWFLGSITCRGGSAPQYWLQGGSGGPVEGLPGRARPRRKRDVEIAGPVHLRGDGPDLVRDRLVVLVEEAGLVRQLGRRGPGAGQRLPARGAFLPHCPLPPLAQRLQVLARDARVERPAGGGAVAAGVGLQRPHGGDDDRRRRPQAGVAALYVAELFEGGGDAE